MTTAFRTGLSRAPRRLLVTLLAAGLILASGHTRGDAPAAAKDDARKDVEDKLEALAAQLKEVAAQLRQQRDQLKDRLEAARKAEVEAMQARADAAQARRRLELQVLESEKKAEKDAALIKDLEAARSREQDAHRKQVQELEAEVKQLKEQALLATAGRKAEHDAALKYMHQVAELFLDSWLAEDYKTLRRSLSPDLLTSLQTSQPGDDIERWAQAVGRGVKYNSSAITTEVLGATMDEAIFRGPVTGKGVKGTFTVQILKDKQTGRSLVSIFRIKPE
jgi:chromosome segregation ATPase